MKKKIFNNEEDYKEYLDEMYDSDKRISGSKERLRDCKETKCDDIELHIAIRSDGFHVYQDNKTFVCQTGEQLISYLKTMSISKSQLLELHDLLLSECMKYDIDFPTSLI